MKKIDREKKKILQRFGQFTEWIKARECPRKKFYLSGKRIAPEGISGHEKLTDLIEETFLAYNAARLKEACQLFTKKMLEPDVTVGMSLAGALTPAGIGASCIVPLIKAGFIDWIVATGANMYHDLHLAFDCPLHVGRPNVNDPDLKENDVVRIYDIFLGYTDCLLTTDAIIRSIITKPEFQKEMSTAEYYYLLGKYVAEWEDKYGTRDKSIIAAAYRAGVPVFTSSPGDSTFGLDIAGLELQGLKLRFNPSKDVNQSASIVLATKKAKGKSAVFLVGGGSPKNFMLQTEPHIQEVLRIKEEGHDYFLQITDARPDTGGLSGATPSEAVSWGKVDPKKLPNAVVCYLDSTVALPIITHYALATHKKRPLKKLYFKLDKMLKLLIDEYFKHDNYLGIKF